MTYIHEVMQRLHATWDNSGACSGCGWHAMLSEHYFDEDDIHYALQHDGFLELACANKDGSCGSSVKVFIGKATMTQNDNAEPLLPCPFCGSAGELHRDGDSDGYMTTPKFAVRCKNCKCSSPYFGGYRNEDNCISDAVKSWNTRTPQPAADDIVLQMVGFTCERTKERHTYNNMTDFVMAFLTMKRERDEAKAALSVLPQQTLGEEIEAAKEPEVGRLRGSLTVIFGAAELLFTNPTEDGVTMFADTLMQVQSLLAAQGGK